VDGLYGVPCSGAAGLARCSRLWLIGLMGQARAQGGGGGGLAGAQALVPGDGLDAGRYNGSATQLWRYGCIRGEAWAAFRALWDGSKPALD